MIHPNCAERGHNWDMWEMKYCRADGVPVVTWPDGSFECAQEDMPKLRRYTRQCQNMGCDGVQFAENLEPSGQSEIVDTHKWDKALAELAALKEKGGGQ